MDEEWGSNDQLMKKGYIRVSDFESLPFYLKAHVVDEVIIFLPLKSLYDQAFQIAKLCEQQGIIVRFPSDLFSLQKGEMKAEHFEEDSVVTVYTGQMRGWQILVKRVLDFFFSLILLLPLLPLFFVVACLIKINSPGDAIFAQERIGLNKRRFALYEFRTMVREADKMQAELENLNEADGPVFKIKDDPRITPIGKFLRKTSLDEFPQLINVLKGDMSLVGPRPLPVRDYEGFDEDWHRRRFSVRPGIICLWQINGRNNTPFEKWMGLDMEYIDHWSLWLDFKILAKTIPAVLRGSGAT